MKTEENSWNLNLLSVNAWTSSNSASVKLQNYTNINSDLLRSNIIGTSGHCIGSSGIDLTGPSLTVSKGNKLAYGFITRSRTVASFWNLDGRLLSEIGEIIKVSQEYPYQLDRTMDMRTNIVSFSELAFMGAFEVLNSGKHRLIGGVTLKYINGISHTSIETNQLTGEIKLNRDDVAYLTNSTGFVKTRTAGELFDRFTVGNFFKLGKASLGMNVGFTYTYGKPYKLRLGVSLTDLGFIRYKADKNYSKSYDVHIASNQGLYFNNNFANSSFSRTTKVFEKYPDLFTKKSSSDSIYRIGLPTTFGVQADYQLNNNWNIESMLGIGMHTINNSDNIYYFSVIKVIPKWIKRNISISIPFSVQKYTGVYAGARFAYKGIFIGSNSVISSIIESRQIDMHLGIELLSH
ncbi:DUF5723 family protein [Dyadobacter subterraneus]|uniref:DUF5723 domain-containing protein n=1 Tax=Dyadobacter subterraneus TaxID=2773304 RepID=A0ABR9WMA4_9BACT|nr:DUF5723 family protein [Dyadobacter subterraneus]MBE9466627.1 hypothetical protein [Dyadobacter subterraneus]